MRTNRRTRATVLGIAFASLLLVAGFALVEGMRSTVDAVADRMDPGPILFLEGDDLAASEIDASRLQALSGPFQSVRLGTATLAIGSDTWTATVAYVEGSDGSPLWTVATGEVLLGASLRSRLERRIPVALGTPVDVSSSAATVTLDVAGTYSATRPFPDDWAVVSREDLLALRPFLDASVNAVVVGPDNPDAIDSLRQAGLVEVATVAAPAFLRSGTAEVLTSLLPLVATVGVIVALLVHNAMGVEVIQRSAEIRLLRQSGAGPRRISGLYFGQALFLAILGGLLGLAGGIVAAYGIVSFAPLVGLANVVSLSVSPGLAVLALGLCLVAGCIGGLVPALRAGRLNRPPREVVPSS